MAENETSKVPIEIFQKILLLLIHSPETEPLAVALNAVQSNTDFLPSTRIDKRGLQKSF